MYQVLQNTISKSIYLDENIDKTVKIYVKYCKNTISHGLVLCEKKKEKRIKKVYVI